MQSSFIYHYIYMMQNIRQKNHIQVTIYIPPKFERDSTKNDKEIGGRRWWERKKIKSKKEKTLQQQQGLPTMSVDLNNEKSTNQSSHVPSKIKPHIFLLFLDIFVSNVADIQPLKG